jgi:hypothetical protein
MGLSGPGHGRRSPGRIFFVILSQPEGRGPVGSWVPGRRSRPA